MQVMMSIVLLSLLLVYLGYWWWDHQEEVGVNFRDLVEKGGALEEKYLQPGPYQVTRLAFKAKEPIKTIAVYYPAQMGRDQKNYPLLILANGTASRERKYQPIFYHLASWGFIVVGTQDRRGGKGQTTIRAYDFIQKQSQDPSSLLYQGVDWDKVGLIGFSQGGGQPS